MKKHFKRKQREVGLIAGFRCHGDYYLPEGEHNGPNGWRLPASLVAVGVISCTRHPYWGRVEEAHRTWGQHFEAFAAYTYDQVVDGDWRKQLHTYGADEPIGRETTLPLAMVSAMLADFPSAKWYIITDDDTFIIPHNLGSVLAKLDQSRPFIMGQCGQYPPRFTQDQHRPNQSDWETWNKPEAKPSRHAGFSLESGPIPHAFVIGAGGIIVSRAMAEALAPVSLDCRKKYSPYTFGDARLGACVRDVFGDVEWTVDEGWRLTDHSGAGLKIKRGTGAVRCYEGMSNFNAVKHNKDRFIWDVDGPLDHNFWDFRAKNELPVGVHIKNVATFRELWNEVRDEVAQRELIYWDRLTAKLLMAGSLRWAGE